MTDNPESSIEARISEYRHEIDAIDQELLELLNRRAQAALAIGELKVAASKPFYDPQREAQIIDNVLQANQGPLNNESVRFVFGAIMRVDKKAQTGEKLQEDSPSSHADKRGFGWRTGGSW